MRISHIPLALLAASLILAGPAHAFHRKTAAIVPLTTDGDTDLYRVPSQGRRAIAFVRADVAGTPVVSVIPHKTGSAPSIVFSGGDNRNPATSGTGKTFAWDTDADPLGSGKPGRQVVISFKGVLIQAALDDTGTSSNPSLDSSGRIVVFESEGDLAGTGNSGARQIFLREKSGLLRQVSTGEGDSRNPMLSRRKRLLSYESTSDPVTGVDTGISQIFVGRYDQTLTKITAGAGASRNATISDDGRLVVFESLADLAGSGAATGDPQIFVYDTRSETFAQVTDDAGGCTAPGAHRLGGDWRVTFICGDEAQFFQLRENARYRIQTPGGTVQSILPGLGSHFVILSTTANLFSGGSTAGHQIYMVNEFVRPAEPIGGTATWFPFQGIS